MVGNHIFLYVSNVPIKLMWNITHDKKQIQFAIFVDWLDYGEVTQKIKKEVEWRHKKGKFMSGKHVNENSCKDNTENTHMLRRQNAHCPVSSILPQMLSS